MEDFLTKKEIRAALKRNHLPCHQATLLGYESKDWFPKPKFTLSKGEQVHFLYGRDQLDEIVKAVRIYRKTVTRGRPV